MGVKFPDFSHYQTLPGEMGQDFAAIAAAYPAVILKATQGATGVDATFATRWRAAHDAGLLCGAYHFGNGDNPELQAAHFLATVNPGPDDLLVLDWECAPMTMDQARAFVENVQAQTNRLPVLYGGLSFFQSQNIAADSVLAQCPLWLAAYRDAPPAPPAPWTEWAMWQFSDKETINGVSGPVDMNVSKFDDAAALTPWWKGQ
jgi:lysozyme